MFSGAPFAWSGASGGPKLLLRLAQAGKLNWLLVGLGPALAIWRHAVFQAYDVAAPELAVDRDVEQRKIADLTLNLELRPD